MRIPLYISSYHDSQGRRLKRASHLGSEINWSDRLPQLWRSLTIGPIWIDVNRDLDAGAERWVGFDEEEAPCYCRYRFKVDIGSLGATPDYVEDLVAWRMRDGRWLIHRIIKCHADRQTAYAFYGFSESMPR